MKEFLLGIEVLVLEREPIIGDIVVTAKNIPDAFDMVEKKIKEMFPRNTAFSIKQKNAKGRRLNRLNEIETQEMVRWWKKYEKQ